MGTSGDMRAMAEALEKVKGALVQGYAAKSGRTPEEISALMSAETWLDAADALAQGFADRLIEPVRIAASFDVARFRNAPPELVEVVEGDGTGAETVPDGNGSEDTAADIVGSDDDVTPDADATPRSEPARTEVADDDAPPADADPETGVAATNAAPDAGSIRAEAIGHARAVIDLCRLAGQPQIAGRFLEADAGLDEVRVALLAAKAEAEPEIAPHHPQPGRGSAARPWGEIVARTFKLKGS
jgi:hypothetical protein